MSRTSCFANFSGSSAFEIRSLILARRRVPTRSRSAMVNLLSKRVATKRVDELASELPTASEDAVKKNEQCDGEKSSARETMPSVAASVSVVPVRTEISTMEAIGVPQRPEEKAENQRVCDEDEDCWEDEKSDNCVF